MSKKNKTPAKISEPTLNDESSKEGYLWSMSYAHSIDTPTVGLQLLPIIMFSALVIMIVRLYRYNRDMNRFYWSSSTDGLIDFFSHYKVILIVVCTVLALTMLLYRIVTQSLYIKRTVFYYPMLIYIFFVLLSYMFSSEKLYAWHGWNDRFEGTYTLICYMIMLFYIINSINSEINVKWIIYPLAAATVILSLLGISQFLDMDFFRTVIGQKLLVTNDDIGNGMTYWQHIEQEAAEGRQALKFTFQNREIYQTVYNINYVSFYLTLLLPLFGMLFIREKRMHFKAVWGVLTVMVLINLIGSASSGGFLGMFFVVLLGIIILNKRIIKWWRSVSVLIVMVVIVAGITHYYMSETTGHSWFNEISSAVASALDSGQTAPVPAGGQGAPASTPTKTKIDYFINDGFDIIFSIDGNEATITTDPVDYSNFKVTDSSGQILTLESTHLAYDRTNEEADSYPAFTISDPRFSAVQLFPASSGQNDTGAENTETAEGAENSEETDNADAAENAEGAENTEDTESADAAENVDSTENAENTGDVEVTEILNYCVFRLSDHDIDWPFIIREDGTYYHNQMNKYIKLENVPAIGWSDNPAFGSGRGYIWSRTLPMISKTIFIGHGADTYCLYYPHKDYVGKYNAGWNINTIVDKPHNMYLASAVGTGLISTLTLIVLFMMYLFQSIQVYWKESYNDFSSIVGVGVFLGVIGFAISGFVDDSTVSVMPMFYGLLGLGIAINMMIARKRKMKLLIS